MGRAEREQDEDKADEEQAAPNGHVARLRNRVSVIACSSLTPAHFSSDRYQAITCSESYVVRKRSVSVDQGSA